MSADSEREQLRQPVEASVAASDAPLSFASIMTDSSSVGTPEFKRDAQGRIEEMLSSGKPVYSAKYDGDALAKITFPSSEKEKPDGGSVLTEWSIERGEAGQYQLTKQVETYKPIQMNGGLRVEAPEVSRSSEPLQNLSFDPKTGELAWTQKDGSTHRITDKSSP